MKTNKELDKIFSLEFIAAPEMIIDSEGLLFRWNPEWLAETQTAIEAYIIDRVVAAKLWTALHTIDQLQLVWEQTKDVEAVRDKMAELKYKASAELDKARLTELRGNSQ